MMVFTILIAFTIFNNEILCATTASKLVFLKTDKQTSKSVTKTPAEVAGVDVASIEDTKAFLRNNGYDLLDNEIEKTVKIQIFESMKAFNENKAIQETIKWVFSLN